MYFLLHIVNQNIACKSAGGDPARVTAASHESPAPVAGWDWFTARCFRAAFTDNAMHPPPNMAANTKAAIAMPSLSASSRDDFNNIITPVNTHIKNTMPMQMMAVQVL